VYFNPDNYVSNRFYRIVPHQGYSIESLAAYLNSTLGWLQKELLGRTNLGQGALDTQGTDLSRILVPNRLVSNIISKNAMNAFLNIGKRKALPVKEELGQGDRIELDRLILDAMGWLEYRSELYEAVYDLVAARLQRARSI